MTEIRPTPTDAEAAAIVAAVGTALASSSTGGAAEDPTAATPVWRFSGRWWNQPLPRGRARP